MATADIKQTTSRLADAAENKALIDSTQRLHLVNAAIADLKALGMASSSDLPESLKATENTLSNLQNFEGGKSSQSFQDDLETINQQVNPKGRIDQQQQLPFLEITGIDTGGHIQVNDAVDGKLETLQANLGLLEPDAPLDNSMAGKLYGAGDWQSSIKPSAIAQGRFGDCYFLSALTNLVQLNPSAVKEMIQDNGVGGDGRHTYTVIFPGAKSTPLEVPEPNLYDTTAKAQDSKGLWVNVLEEAYRKLTGKDTWDSGGSATDAMTLLTGNNAAQLNVSTFDTSALGDLFSHVPETRSIISANSGNGARVTDANGNTVQIAANHCYALVGYNPQTGMVTVSNPWGSNGLVAVKKIDSANPFEPSKFDNLLSRVDPAEESAPHTGPLLTMSLRDFQRAFATIAVGSV